MEKHADVGDHVTLSCDHMIHSPPAEHVIWTFNPTFTNAHRSDQLNLVSDDIICLPNRSICTLLNITSAQAGRYECHFYQGQIAKFVSYKLFVHPRHMLDRHSSIAKLIEEVSSPAVVDVNKGESIILQCAFIGNLATPSELEVHQTNSVQHVCG